MANSYAYVLSANKYPDAFQANLIGTQQGTIIVYAAAETLSSGDVLFTDSKLTQPVYGDPAEWYGVQLLTNTSVKYPITIGVDNEIVVGSGTTTTTAAPTTTTTTIAFLSHNIYVSMNQTNACNEFNGSSFTAYSSVPLAQGVTLYQNTGLTNVFPAVVYGGNIKDKTTSLVYTTTGTMGSVLADNGTSCSQYTTTTTTSAPTTTTTTAAVYTIGQAALGGVIAYINGGGSTGTSGLVATAADIATNIEWGCLGTSITTSTAIGTGNANTIAITTGCATAGIAAILCADLTEGGYSDWYLPSLDELNALYVNRDAIGGFGGVEYWSSSQDNASLAWDIYFANGQQYSVDKDTRARVRAIRSF